MTPADRRAPGTLGAIQDLLNTVDVEDGEERLDSPRALASWLRERALIGDRDRVTEADLREALELREGLRDLLSARADPAAAEAAVVRLERACGPFELRASFAGARPAVGPAGRGARGALATLVVAAARAEAEGTWTRLKVCADPACRWAFYDVTRNRSGRWCSMAVCGNRQKARAHRARTGAA